MNVRLRLNNYLLPIFTIIVLILQILDGSAVWMLLLIALGTTWLISYLWARSLVKGIRWRRQMRFGWAQVGDALEEQLTFENHSWAPALWLEISDNSSLPDHTISQATGVQGYAQKQWHVHSICTQRGEFKLGPTSFESSDPFGIYRVVWHDPTFVKLTVTPPTISLPWIKITTGGQLGEGRPRPNVLERSVSAATVREYIPGDSLHTIHWPTTARRDEPFVQVFDGTPAGDWWVIADLDQRTQTGEGWESTVELSVILAASLIDLGLKEHHPVGLISNAAPTIWQPPRQDEYHRWEIMRALARATTSETSFPLFLERSRSAISHGSNAILITADITAGWLEPLLQWTWRGITPTILLIDPLSFGAEPHKNYQTSTTAEYLSQLGITTFVISSEMLQRPELRPGQSGQWEWRIMPTGRAVQINKPTDSSWQPLT